MVFVNLWMATTATAGVLNTLLFVMINRMNGFHKEKATHIKTHASKRLRLNLRILSVVYLILLFVTLYDVVVSEALFSQVLPCFDYRSCGGCYLITHV